MNEAINTVSAENGSANGLLPDDNHEEGVGSAQQENASIVRDGSPGGLSPSIRKGYGLKKWRRIKRDSLVTEGVVAIDSSKVLKRGLSGPVNPPKPADLSSIEARQSSEGSVGSVNMMNHLGSGKVFSPVPGSAFIVGQAFSESVGLEKSEDRNSKVECGSSVGGKISSGSLSQRAQQGKSQIDTIKKARAEQVEGEKENPSCSLDSDLRSTDFVFSSGAFSHDDKGKHGEKLLNEYRNEGQQFSREDQNGHRKENGEREEDSVSKDYLSRLENDLLADSIRNLAAVQEALEKEVQNFSEIGRDSIPLHRSIDESGFSSDQPGNVENPRENSSESQVPILKQRVTHLESKLGEAKAKLEAKDAKIRELENSKIETELEGILQRKMEAEIEHLLLTRSLEEPKKTRNLREDPGHKSGNISGRAFKSGLCFLAQLILLLCILRFFILQLLPDSQIVIPT
ncbi:PREDICTED: WPP domain-interacting protein 3-like [Tarenaya hassleriana]|uniref:WPP domain-interacting protein 3-like n=1 Tax=Tarenaya hassleriana TaxID=28532 RepID=UPI00053C3E89|nr:PREDICTED: WPP domain-interacting protein 3-like [Tarenaya hassleriana]XP_010542486.1 PREDICTED: WPP domain-interacting protein 3-like [Tarenaya hassleriana]XP_010542487.1 PREDICTED: WPP domain-interacting protein 3-like [Tarenaya hassleriana]